MKGIKFRDAQIEPLRVLAVSILVLAVALAGYAILRGNEGLVEVGLLVAVASTSGLVFAQRRKFQSRELFPVAIGMIACVGLATGDLPTPVAAVIVLLCVGAVASRAARRTSDIV